jgi:hypothetical protein
MMIDALGTRGPSLGRCSRDRLGPRSCSDSEAEEEADEGGDAAFVEMAGLGCGGVAVAEGLSDAITPVKGKSPKTKFSARGFAGAQGDAGVGCERRSRSEAVKVWSSIGRPRKGGFRMKCR